MKRISLSQGKVALVDDADYTSLNRYSWCAIKSHNTYYAMRRSPGLDSKRQVILMHRLILSAPDGIEIDHINSEGLDNRRSNLRLCNHSENSKHRNLNYNNKTGFKGVCVVKQKIVKPFRAQIALNYNVIHVGYYCTAEEAARAYDKAALKYHGEFALTNETLRLY